MIICELQSVFEGLWVDAMPHGNRCDQTIDHTKINDLPHSNNRPDPFYFDTMSPPGVFVGVNTAGTSSKFAGIFPFQRRNLVWVYFNM